MNDEKLTAILGLIVPQVVSLIVKNHGGDELTAANDFYGSGVYAALERESTKLWHLSPRMLFYLYDEEQKTGVIPFPEEA